MTCLFKKKGSFSYPLICIPHQLLIFLLSLICLHYWMQIFFFFFWKGAMKGYYYYVPADTSGQCSHPGSQEQM